MKSRLLRYLESLGLDAGADESASIEFHENLDGLERAIANTLDYDEANPTARTLADTALRALGVDLENPKELAATPGEPEEGAAGGARGKAKRGEASTPPPETGGEDVDDAVERTMQRFRLEERKRAGAIRKLGKENKIDPAVIERAIEDDLSVDSAGRRFLAWTNEQRGGVDFDLGGAPAGHSRSSVTGYTREALAAALMVGRLDIDDPTAHLRGYSRVTGAYGRAKPTDELNDAEKRAGERGYELAGLSMLEIVARCYRLDGIDCDPVVGSVVEAGRSAAGSGGTVDFVFEQAFGASMMNGYERAQDTTEGWVSVGQNPNFKSQPTGRMEKTGVMTKHARGGQADMITVSDTKEFTKVNRYSSRFVIDEMDLDDDRFGNLDVVPPAEMGAAARELRPDLVYALLMSNPALASDATAIFHADHGNLGSGALSKLSIQALCTKLSLQTEGTANLNIKPRYVIAPTTKRFDLREILKNTAQVAAGGDTNARYPSYNALADEGLTPVFDARLDNGVVDPDTGTKIAGDDAAFYVTSEKSEIVVSYKRGSSRGPESRSGTLDNGQWGKWHDVKMDIGADPIGYRRMAKSTGS